MNGVEVEDEVESDSRSRSRNDDRGAIRCGSMRFDSMRVALSRRAPRARMRIRRASDAHPTTTTTTGRDGTGRDVVVVVAVCVIIGIIEYHVHGVRSDRIRHGTHVSVQYHASTPSPPPRASASFTLGMDGWMIECFEWMHSSTRRTRVDGADARVEAFSVFSGCSSRVRETERLANAIDREIARAR